MDIEQGIQKQRVALLRLLAGWFAVVVFLSAAPVSPVWTRWVRGFLNSVLLRAEAAAQCLVIVQARLLDCGREDRAWSSRLPFDPLSAFASDRDEPPSLAELRARLLALRCLLNSLPRRGLRLLRRVEKAEVAAATLSERSHAHAGLRREWHLANRQCPPPLPWHPPELA